MLLYLHFKTIEAVFNKVQGYIDNRGKQDTNIILSEKRAQTVEIYSRKQFYDFVWSEPLAAISKKIQHFLHLSA